MVSFRSHCGLAHLRNFHPKQRSQLFRFFCNVTESDRAMGSKRMVLEWMMSRRNLGTELWSQNSGVPECADSDLSNFVSFSLSEPRTEHVIRPGLGDAFCHQSSLRLLDSEFLPQIPGSAFTTACSGTITSELILRRDGNRRIQRRATSTVPRPPMTPDAIGPKVRPASQIQIHQAGWKFRQTGN